MKYVTGMKGFRYKRSKRTGNRQREMCVSGSERRRGWVGKGESKETIFSTMV